MSDLRKSVLGGNKGRRLLTGPVQNFNPVKWSKYFDTEKLIKTNNGNFHIYKRGNVGPLIVCLHGGGYSGLTWALLSTELFQSIDCQIVALDLRGHGFTTTTNDSDLSLETLANDVVQVIETLLENSDDPVVLVGHSMGGSVAVEAAIHTKNLVGLCVIDVVEGTAMDALSSMQSYLRGRPKQFSSLHNAIKWSYKGGQTHNIEAARVSMPGQLINIKGGNLAPADFEDKTENELNEEEKNSEEFKKPLPSQMTTGLSEISEESEEIPKGLPPLPFKTTLASIPTNQEMMYTWRIDLSKTEAFWPGWFKGLSNKFLQVPCPKILLLANIHGLDTTLTVGQMQGKFQLQVLSKSGHAIHEDQPHHVSDILVGFLVKQRIANAKQGFVAPPPCC